MPSLPAPDLVALATRRLDDRMPTIIQHLMTALGRRTRVLYVEPPMDPVFLLRRRGAARLGKAPGPDRLSRYVPGALPFERRLPGLGAANRALVARQVRRRLAAWRRDGTVLWVPSPRFAGLAEKLVELPVCYYVSDEYTRLPSMLEGSSREQVAGRERRLLDRARWVMVSSPVLLDSRAPRQGTAHWVPAGVDVQLFERALDHEAPLPADLAPLPRPVAGFVGALDAYKVDFELLGRCAEALPEVSFVTIGPGSRADGQEAVLPQAPNLHHLGWRPYEALPDYLRGLDVAMLPNHTSGYMEACFPMKLLQYFAAGLPVVATDLPSLRRLSDWLYIGRDADEFVVRVRQALDDDDDDGRRRRLELARRNDWDHQARRVLDILGGVEPEPVLGEPAAGP